MDVHEQVLTQMQEMAAKFAAVGVSLEMPPASSRTLGTRYVESDHGKHLAAEIRYNAQFGNPTRAFQGGFLCAAFDEVFGPLSYMACGRPVVTVEMSTTYLRPFSEKDEFIVIRAEVVARSRTILVLKAEARNQHSKLIATATSHSVIASDDNLRARPAAT